MKENQTNNDFSSNYQTEYLQQQPSKIKSLATDDITVIRRNNEATKFDGIKITIAITKAFLAVEGGTAASSHRIHDKVEILTEEAINNLTRRMINNTIHIEDIQDQVELALMRSGEHKVARAYILYREQRIKERAKATSKKAPLGFKAIKAIKPDGSSVQVDQKAMIELVKEACENLEYVDANTIIKDTLSNLFDGVKIADVSKTLILSTRNLIVSEPNYSLVTARLLLDTLRQEALSLLKIPLVKTQSQMSNKYKTYFKKYLKHAIESELLDPRLNEFDIDKITSAIKPQRDLNFTYLGLQNLYDRYFIQDNGIRFELPQAFFMRVAMGLAINEIDRESKSIEFYNLLSSFDFMSSTPTLFNSATLRPQLSSCYLTTVPDHLDGIFSAIKDNALLSKFAGGLGNDWTRVRGMGSHIKGTNGKSQGVVPFLKVSNDTAVAVNQGGKRKGAICAYLETWHIDIEDFLELRKNTGDDRRRTHDMNTANWIPDLFMQRVVEDQEWTLFSPDEVSDLHDLTDEKFASAYQKYEQKAKNGEIKLFKTLKAVDLWRKILGMLFETGHPWITFKDACNNGYTNQHLGVVHSSNLCTEITLHTNDEEIAVCNLGSINLVNHVDSNGLNHDKLKKSIKTAMRMLDNVIDYNYYAVPQARKSNLRHRPVGLGVMGFQDALFKLRIPYASEQAIDFADISMEAISYYAISSSSDLAQERGAYPSYQGSLWSQGILPIDSVNNLVKKRGKYAQMDNSQTLDWDALRKTIIKQGMRNSNTLAIAPTATISNICGVSQSIEPIFQNINVKSNLSGDFAVLNPYLVHDLKKLNLWDEIMINDLKHFDGRLAQIDRIPEDLKQLYQTAFELDSRWLIECGARRQKWIDQGQSLNIYIDQPSGKILDNIYKLAWVRGLKTTYYLRSQGATAMEKATDNNPANACLITDPDCDACQ